MYINDLINMLYRSHHIILFRRRNHEDQQDFKKDSELENNESMGAFREQRALPGQVIINKVNYLLIKGS